MAFGGDERRTKYVGGLVTGAPGLQMEAAHMESAQSMYAFTTSIMAQFYRL